MTSVEDEVADGLSDGYIVSIGRQKSLEWNKMDRSLIWRLVGISQIKWKKKQVDTNLVMVELRVFQPKIELSTMTIPYAFRLGLRQYLRPSN